MRNIMLVTTSLLCLTSLIGCANDAPLGSHVAQLKQEQMYNKQATEENMGVIPTGSGERMEGAYHVYTGKKGDSLAGSDSQFIEGFSQ
ncbi:MULTISPECIES: hypothetical protein [Vibrio]|uniref:Lipoprotein n=2 Tax=Vibrio TaxID=662 RepID=A0A1E5CYW3_9VIBR|nr:hypothetical protein [Vibrio genomosp. F6]OEE76016.1 hypothetical protein A130_16180 [Vibrio genomosp. F6 str. FF-238]TKF20592.1 hypothetical protein FCV43_13885 [Vibrio genomosp. F6]